MSMEFAGPRVNIAIEVQGFERIADFAAAYTGRVIAPYDMAGQNITIHLSHPQAWKYFTMREEVKAAAAETAETLQAHLALATTEQEVAKVKREALAADKERAAGFAKADEYLRSAGFSNEASLEKGVLSLFSAYAEEGTIAVFQSCRRVVGKEANVWGSWLAERTGVAPTTDVMHGMCRVNVKAREGAKPHVNVDVLFTHKARTIKTADDLRKFFADYLIPRVGGYENNANCLFRIRPNNPSSEEMICFWAYTARESVSYVDQRGQERRFMIPASLERTWQEAVVDGSQAKGLCRVLASALGLPVGEMDEIHQEHAHELAEGLKSGAYVVEAVPGQRHRVIGDAVLPEPRHLARLQATVDVCTIDDGEKLIQGFYPMMAVVQYGRPASMRYVPQQGGSIVVTRIIFDSDSTPKKLDQIELELDHG